MATQMPSYGAYQQVYGQQPEQGWDEEQQADEADSLDENIIHERSFPVANFARRPLRDAPDKLRNFSTRAAKMKGRQTARIAPAALLLLELALEDGRELLDPAA